MRKIKTGAVAVVCLFAATAALVLAMGNGQSRDVDRSWTGSGSDRFERDAMIGVGGEVYPPPPTNIEDNGTGGTNGLWPSSSKTRERVVQLVQNQGSSTIKEGSSTIRAGSTTVQGHLGGGITDAGSSSISTGAVRAGLTGILPPGPGMTNGISPIPTNRIVAPDTDITLDLENGKAP